MRRCRVLLVDDEEKFIELLKQRLTRKGYSVEISNCSLKALNMIEETEFDVALFDIMMNGMDGLALLEKAKKIQPNLEIIMLTGYATVDTAIEAMKKGAYDYLTKPIKPIELELILQKALDRKKLQDYSNNLIETIQRTNKKREIIGNSDAIISLKYMIDRVSDSSLPVLILGESGTGKELVANALHYHSLRAHHPFVPINASAIPSQLLESELFGHVKGAFTGAQVNKKGLVELADEGTLFLDEIGDMEASLQVKLLRFLDTGEFRPVGGTVTKKTNVRVVAATNINLEQAIEEGRFREDLYYRLSVVTLNVPPLRERGRDALVLAEYFLRQSNSKKKLSKEAEMFLLNYTFPGNVRELANLIERGILLSKDNDLYPNDFFARETYSKNNMKSLALQDIEKEHICQVLEKTGWNKTEAAKILKIGLRTLYRKIEEYKLQQ
ncbi:sigma-54-dependent transcriptional regulator [Alkaliphilus oremlandii]|uniref:Stage 0 sporulation protein A homolog n=1 Tax=Alkaliphilus oremlandii (strain OhILAs) TaxID=350688 RepID=A8MKV1_ALKOO|nr:sigma-54 dependent transcriptional regulator [Alkaliphilus oremlandii]ABW17768.1 two component, sigma54 specific, transcriptional regulator, Fis family [Alkaliphilus oremlandii OhILAs]